MKKRKWELFKETAELGEVVVDPLEFGLPPNGRIYDLAQLPDELKQVEAATKVNKPSFGLLGWFGL